MSQRAKQEQTRTLITDFQTREETSGEKIIEGYFCVFNTETELIRIRTSCEHGPSRCSCSH